MNGMEKQGVRATEPPQPARFAGCSILWPEISWHQRPDNRTGPFLLRVVCHSITPDKPMSLKYYRKLNIR